MILLIFFTMSVVGSRVNFVGNWSGGWSMDYFFDILSPPGQLGIICEGRMRMVLNMMNWFDGLSGFGIVRNWGWLMVQYGRWWKWSRNNCMMT